MQYLKSIRGGAAPAVTRRCVEPWEDVEFPDRRRCALLCLMGKIDELPGAVYFEVPLELAVNDESWAEIVAGTTALCACGRRRVLYPTRGRSWFVPHRYRAPYPVMADAPVFVGPHKADGNTAYVRVEFDGEKITINPLGNGAEPTTYSLGDFIERVRTEGPLVITRRMAGVTVPICVVDHVADSVIRPRSGVVVGVDKGSGIFYDMRDPHACN